VSTDGGRAAEIAALLSQLAELLAASERPQDADTPQVTPDVPQRVLLTVDEAAKRLGIGRTTAFALVKSGEIASVQIGRLRRVSADAVTDYAARLATEQRHQRKVA
jgi:excisionase family DNA binding protein